MPWTEKPGRLQSMGSQRVRHDWARTYTYSVGKDLVRGFPGTSAGKELPAMQETPLITGSERFPGEGIDYPLQYSWASLVAQLVKNLPAVSETRVQSWVRKILWRGKSLPSPVFWPKEFHGLYSPWSCREWHTTEWLSLSQVIFQYHFSLSLVCILSAYNKTWEVITTTERVVFLIPFLLWITYMFSYFKVVITTNLSFNNQIISLANTLVL